MFCFADGDDASEGCIGRLSATLTLTIYIYLRLAASWTQTELLDRSFNLVPARSPPSTLLCAGFFFRILQVVSIDGSLPSFSACRCTMQEVTVSIYAICRTNEPHKESLTRCKRKAIKCWTPYPRLLWAILLKPIWSTRMWVSCRCDSVSYTVINRDIWMFPSKFSF